VYYTPRFQFLAYREQARVFSEFAAVSPLTANVTVDGEPASTWVLEITEDTLPTLGIRPALGRGFLPGEFHSGANDVVVISDLFWRKNLRSAPDVLGRQVTIDRRPCTVVGVLAPDQRFPTGFGGSVYRPIVLSEDPNNLFLMLSTIGRMKDGTSREQALAALSATRLPVLPQWAADYLSHQRPILGRLTEVERPRTMWVILGAAAFLYAISCLNAMNLMLIRLLGRRRELSIRFALGGSRLQVVRLLILESLALSGTASIAVAVLAKWVFPPLFAALDHDDAALFHDYWDWGTLSCIAALSLVACLAAVLVPAFRLLTTDIHSGLKDGGPTMGESRAAGRVRNSLVVLQSAFAVILLIGTGLMVRSFDRLHHLDLGFDPVGKVKVRIAFPRNEEVKPEARVQLFEHLQQRLAAIPGVRSASFSQDSIFIGYFAGSAELQLEDGRYEPVAGNFVSADFLKTAGLELKEGRWLSGRRGEVEAVISESMAKERFGNRDPLGLSFKIKVSGDHQYPIVGVVRDVRDVVRAPAGIRFYVPYWMYPSNIDSLVLRLDSDPGREFESVVRRAVNEVDPGLIVPEVSSINEMVGNSMASERYAFTILRVLAVIAFGLTVVGLFSVIAYTVDSRLTEFGVRIALGATSSDLKRIVLARGLGAASLGLAIGIAGAVGLTRFMESLLFETEPYDPSVYLGVSVVLVAASVAACWLPARRAARVDVVKLLRAD
jgi:putative ABC transport system permease protein